MDDDLTQLAYPTYALVTATVEAAAGALVALACLLLVRRAPAPALLGALGALAAGTSSALWLAAYDRRLPDPLVDGDLFWELTSYARSVGLALMGLALVLALVRTRKR